MTIRTLHGDCRDVLPTLDAESVQCVVTSPPYYGLRDYGTAQWEGGDPNCDHRKVQDEQSAVATSTLGGGKKTTGHLQEGFRSSCGRCGAFRVDKQIGLEPTPEEYVAQLVAVFHELRRVLRQDGCVWLNLGDSYSAGGNGAGGVGSVKQLTNVGSWLPSKKAPPGYKPKDLLGIPWRVAFALQADGWWLRSALPWIKRSCMPESCTDRPTNAVECVFLLAKAPQYFWDYAAVQRKGAVAAGTRAAKGSNVRSKLKDVNGRPPEYWDYTGTRNFRNTDLFFDSLSEPAGLICDDAGEPLALDVNPEPFAGAHFATFPPGLVVPLIKAGTSERGCCPHCGAPWGRTTAPGEITASGGKGARYHNARLDDSYKPGSADDVMTARSRITLGWQPTCSCPAHDPIPQTVLDPFSGAGTTGLVADRLGRNAILIELNPDYASMGAGRIMDDAPLFAQVAAE